MTFKSSSSLTTTKQPSCSGFRLGSANSTAVAPQAKAKNVQGSLLFYLDSDYLGRNHIETSSTLQSQPKPIVDTSESVTTCAENRADISIERQLDEECRNDTDDIFANADDTQIEVADLTPGQQIADVAVEEDEVIPATPPNPAAPPRSKMISERKSMHDRQKKITDFLLRK